MHTTALIRRHISALRRGDLFTTRDCLNYGARAAVDQALYRLVETGVIERLARGVFLKPDWPRKAVSALEVARIKAAAFGKKIITDCADAAHKLGLSGHGNRGPTFAISGRSSSFRFGDIVIRLRGVSARKMRLADSAAGQSMRALWHLGKQAFCSRTVEVACAGLRRTDKEEIRGSGAWIPSWILDHFWRLRR